MTSTSSIYTLHDFDKSLKLARNFAIIKPLGVIHSPMGDISVIEYNHNGEIGKKLVPLCITVNDQEVPIATDDPTIRGLERFLEGFGGNELEYRCIDTSDFPLPEYVWDGWNPLHSNKLTVRHDEIYKELERAVTQYVGDRKKILVTGCGDGSFLDRLSEMGYDAHGIELNSRNVELAHENGRNVHLGAIEDLQKVEEYDVIIDPGVLSDNVVSEGYTRETLPILFSYLRPKGIFIEAPLARTWITSHLLHQNQLTVMEMTVPKNLFTFQEPKQFYVAQKI